MMKISHACCEIHRKEIYHSPVLRKQKSQACVRARTLLSVRWKSDKKREEEEFKRDCCECKKEELGHSVEEGRAHWQRRRTWSLELSGRKCACVWWRRRKFSSNIWDFIYFFKTNTSSSFLGGLFPSSDAVAGSWKKRSPWNSPGKLKW